MPRPLALDRLLEPARQRELVERRARGATRTELRAWLAGLGIHPTAKQLRVALEHVDRRLERARDQCAIAAAYQADHDPPDVLAERIAALRAEAVAAVGADHPQPTLEYVLRLAERRIMEMLARDELDAKEISEAVAALTAIAETRAKFPSLGPSRKQIIIPPGTVEHIFRNVYGFSG